MKNTNWIIGIVILSILCVVLILLTIPNIAETNHQRIDTDGKQMLGGSDATILARKASELYCHAIYYTDKALRADPQNITYEEWSGDMDRAEEYWAGLETVSNLLDKSVTDQTFEAMFTEQQSRDFALIQTAYALDAKKVLQVFDSAPAGKRLRTLAKHLKSDLKYARAALKMANGQITAEEWNNFGDTSQKLESAARGLRSAGKVAATAAGLMATGGASGVFEVGALTVSGADTLMQIADDGAFIALGDKYDSNEFVAALNKTQDTWGKVAGPVDVLFGNMNDPMDATMFMLTTADNVRSVLKEGKFLGYDLNAAFKGDGATKTTADAAELAQAMLADANGGDVPPELRPILDAMKQQGNYDAIFTALTGAAPVSAVPTSEPTADATPEPMNDNDMEIGTNSTEPPDETADFSRFVGTWTRIGWSEGTSGFGVIPEPRELSENVQHTMEISGDGMITHYVFVQRRESGKAVHGFYDPYVYTTQIDVREDGYHAEVDACWGKLRLHENGYLYFERGEGSDAAYYIYQRE